jgi:hypothetical protein
LKKNQVKGGENKTRVETTWGRTRRPFGRRRTRWGEDHLGKNKMAFGKSRTGGRTEDHLGKNKTALGKSNKTGGRTEDHLGKNKTALGKSKTGGGPLKTGRGRTTCGRGQLSEEDTRVGEILLKTSTEYK